MSIKSYHFSAFMTVFSLVLGPMQYLRHLLIYFLRPCLCFGEASFTCLLLSTASSSSSTLPCPSYQPTLTSTHSGSAWLSPPRHFTSPLYESLFSTNTIISSLPSLQGSTKIRSTHTANPEPISLHTVFYSPPYHPCPCPLHHHHAVGSVRVETGSRFLLQVLL